MTCRVLSYPRLCKGNLRAKRNFLQVRDIDNLELRFAARMVSDCLQEVMSECGMGT
jgi:hypothetical protein